MSIYVVVFSYKYFLLGLRERDNKNPQKLGVWKKNHFMDKKHWTQWIYFLHTDFKNVCIEDASINKKCLLVCIENAPNNASTRGDHMAKKWPGARSGARNKLTKTSRSMFVRSCIRRRVQGAYHLQVSQPGRQFYRRLLPLPSALDADPGVTWEVRDVAALTSSAPLSWTRGAHQPAIVWS